MTIKSLIIKCTQNDREAEKLLYLLFHEQLMKIAFRYCRDIDNAKDVLQNTFIKIFTNLNSFDSKKGNFDQWINRIAVNESLQFIRKKKNGLIVDENFDINASIEESQFNKMTLVEVKTCIDKLPEIHRVILNLYYFESYDHNEIAAILGIDSSHSRTRLSRSRKVLKEKWKVHNLIIAK